MPQHQGRPPEAEPDTSPRRWVVAAGPGRSRQIVSTVGPVMSRDEIAALRAPISGIMPPGAKLEDYQSAPSHRTKPAPMAARRSARRISTRPRERRAATRRTSRTSGASSGDPDAEGPALGRRTVYTYGLDARRLA